MKTYASLSGIDEVFEVGLNRAVTLIAEKREGKGRPGRGAASQPLRELGVHPTTGDAIVVMPGRYGPYVKSGKVNATVPKGTEVDALTLEAAVELVNARGAGEAKPAKKAAAKAKPAAKKAAAPKKAVVSKAKAKTPAAARAKAAS